MSVRGVGGFDLAQVEHVIAGIYGVYDATVERADRPGDVRAAVHPIAARETFEAPILVLFAGEALRQLLDPSASTFTLKTFPASTSSSVFEVLSRHTSTRGGSRLTEEKPETVIPCTRSASRAVTTVTPLAQLASARLNVSASKGLMLPHSDQGQVRHVRVGRPGHDQISSRL